MASRLTPAAPGRRFGLSHAPIAVEVINGVRAGNASGGALCHALPAGRPVVRVIGFAAAAGALVASRLGCADDMPTSAEVETLIGVGV